MKLDKRIIEGKKPLNALDTEEAKQFIGKEGYFTDVLVAFTDISRNKTSVLTAIDEKAQSCFIDDTGRVKWDYFLPAEWVKEPEKKWRPFSLTEWRHEYAIGDDIVFRMKGSDTVRAYMYCGLIFDHDNDSPGKGVINIGGELFVLQNLFEKFELCRNDEWQPFGVIDEDKE